MDKDRNIKSTSIKQIKKRSKHLGIISKKHMDVIPIKMILKQDLIFLIYTGSYSQFLSRRKENLLIEPM